MPIPAYTKNRVVDNNIEPDLTTLKGKSVVVTGGANGIGEGYVRAFASAGAFVTFGDINEARSNSLISELEHNVQFVKCDTRSWDDQLQMFKQAVANSPSKSVDIVIANAGIAGKDNASVLEDPAGEPTKPDLSILDINLTGVMYTVKLGQHFLRGQPESDERDRCLVLGGSLAGYLDLPGAPQYAASKFALRGLMRSLRQTSWREGIRINYIAPWFTATPIMVPEFVAHLKSRNVEFTLVEDAVAATLRIASDKSINGRALATVPRSVDARGYRDVPLDDFKDDDMWGKLQNGIFEAYTFNEPAETAKQ